MGMGSIGIFSLIATLLLASLLQLNYAQAQSRSVVKAGHLGSPDIPHHGESCDIEIWNSHVEMIYEQDRKSIEGFNSFLKSVADRNDMESKMATRNISTKNLCDFGKAEILYCDDNSTSCQCGGKWQRMETKLMIIHGKQECRAPLFTKCRAQEESPFKPFKGWSPCEPGTICKLPKNKDVIRQATLKYGSCLCDANKYDGKHKSTTNPIRRCACALGPCRASERSPASILLTVLGTVMLIRSNFG